MRNGAKWLLFALGMFMGASLLTQVDLVGFVSGEPQRWRVARAQQLWLEGDREQAIQKLDSTLKRGNPSLEELDLLARWGLRQEDYSVVHWACEQASGLVSVEASPGVAQRFASHRAFAFYREHEPDLALECWRPLAQNEALQQSPASLNGHAYLRALVGKELDIALAQIEKALQVYPWSEVERLQRLAQANLNLNQNLAALDYLDAASTLFEPVQQEATQAYDRGMTQLLASPSLRDPQVKSAVQQLRQKHELQLQRGVLLRLQRIEALKRLGKSDAAKLVGDEVRSLGYEPNELTYLVFDDQQLESYAAFLDTRGWIKFRKGQWSSAVDDLRKAVECAETIYQQQLRVVESNTQRQVQSRELEDQWKERQQGLAVMYDHLAQALYELGDLEQAERFEGKVQQLGFQVGPHLY
jgi:hypothetical protein